MESVAVSVTNKEMPVYDQKAYDVTFTHMIAKNVKRYAPRVILYGALQAAVLVRLLP